MRTALTAICLFTILACSWFVVMFLVLRHPGFEWRAALAVGFVAVSVLTLATARAVAPGAVQRAAVALGALLLAAAGVWAITTNVDEGYVDVTGLALIVQSVLAVAFVLRPTWGTVRRLS